MTKSTEALIADIERDGYAIAENLIEDDLIDDILENLERLERDQVKALTPNIFTGFNTVRFFDLLNKGEVWQRVAAHKGVTDVIRGVIGDDCLLSTMGTALIGPGEPQQLIHCDDGLYGMPRPHRHLVCNTVWALSDFNEETGATHVVPGSHLWDHDPDMTKPADSYDSIQAVMPKGSICFIVGTVYHGGGANKTTDQRRMGLTINYCAGAMRQQENLMIATDKDLIKTFSPDLQDLVGYRVSNLGVGHVDAGDPKRLLA